MIDLLSLSCWYFVSFLLSKLHLLKYSNVTQEFIVKTLLFGLCNICDVLCIVTSVITPCNDPGLD
jgi:hypothetical protein